MSEHPVQTGSTVQSLKKFFCVCLGGGGGGGGGLNPPLHMQ